MNRTLIATAFLVERMATPCSPKQDAEAAMPIAEAASWSGASSMPRRWASGSRPAAAPRSTPALVAKAAGNGIRITDAKGHVAVVTTADVYQSNGVIRGMDKVLMS